MSAFKKYWWVVGIALLAGFLHIVPYLYFQNNLGDEYQGIFMAGTYDEDAYLTFINQSRVDKSSFDNPYIFENRNDRINFRYYFLETLAGWKARVLGLPMDKVAILLKFFSSALLFIMLFIFGKSLTGSSIGGILVGVFVLLGNELTPPIAFGHSFLFYDRPINPSVSAIFFFLALFLAWRLFEKNNRLLGLWLGVLVGALAYLYFYFWFFAMTLLFVLFMIAFVRKERELAVNFCLSLITALLTSLPFLVNIFGTFGDAGANAVNIGKNFIVTHRVIIEKVLLAPLVFLIGLLAFLRFKREVFPRQFIKSPLNTPPQATGMNVVLDLINPADGGVNNRDTAPQAVRLFIFLGAVLTAGLLVSNQQVISGMEIQQHHFHFMTNIPIFLLSGAIICWYLLQKLFSQKILIRNILAILIMAGVVAHAVGVQANSYKFWKDESVDRQRWGPVFDWLNTHSKKDDVILANPEISETLPVYTHNYVYGALHAATYPVPTTRLAHNYFVTIYLDGVRTDTARDFFYNTDNRNALGQYIFEGQYWRAKCGSFGCFPDPTLETLIADYQKFLTRSPLVNLKKYKLDYILWDTKRDPVWRLNQYSFLRPVFSADKVILYQVNALPAKQ